MSKLQIAKAPATFRTQPKIPDELSIAVTISANSPGFTRQGKKLGASLPKDKTQTLCNRTDSDTIQFIDPETLEPIGIASQATLHPLLKGPSSGAHSSTHTNGDVFNYNLEFVNGRGLYRLFRVSASTGKTSILATFAEDPSYLHSMFLTENYAIVCVWNAVYANGGASILWTKNMVDGLMDYDSQRSCKWYVVDRISREEGGRGLVAKYESDPFFCFHTINAYEEVEDSCVKVIADLIAYEDLDILKRLYIDNLLSDSPAAATFANMQNCLPRIRRFVLPDIPAKMQNKFPRSTPNEPKILSATSEYLSSKELTPELPTINPRISLKKYRYVYGVLHTGKSTLFDSILKYDVKDQSGITWSRHGHTPGEPIFVPDPSDSENLEDAGILLSVVLDGIAGKSYLLVLDAKTLKEVGKAHVDGVIGFGFHGTHAPL
jgi:torulene dioxygenase